MSKRVLALVRRSGGGANVTDVTPVVVFEHEVPLLEEIHGEGAVDVITDPEKILDDEVRKNRAQQIEHIVKTNGIGLPFTGDPYEEYQRLSMKYGMHPEVRLAVVEKVYGIFREGRFTKACGTVDMESMTAAELREICDELGITYKGNDSKPVLIGAIRAVRQSEATLNDVLTKHGKAA